MKKTNLLLFGALLLAVSCKKNESMLPPQTAEDDVPAATSGRKCAADEVLAAQIQADPQRARNLEALERKTAEFISRGANARWYNGTLYVPVVVNVVMSDLSKVTDAQINSQITVLNEDFNKTNTDLTPGSYLAGYSYNQIPACNITFVLKSVFRKKTTTSSFGLNDAVKRGSLTSESGGLDPTNPGTMLNLWVCDLSSGYLGYAQFPGGSASTDGVVIDYQAFGKGVTGLYSDYNKGRTATHEVGHWFNLRHIWGDRRCGDDYVPDTPPHDDANYGCPAPTHRSRCAGKPLEQWMNYMDYTNDACMYMFTSDQKLRMDAAIDAGRKAYTSTTP